jgi:hypothetical protein
VGVLPATTEPLRCEAGLPSWAMSCEGSAVVPAGLQPGLLASVACPQLRLPNPSSTVDGVKFRIFVGLWFKGVTLLVQVALEGDDACCWVQICVVIGSFTVLSMRCH